MLILLVLVLFPSCLGATEITTGYLLGPKYDHRAFYIRYRVERCLAKNLFRRGISSCRPGASS